MIGRALKLPEGPMRRDLLHAQTGLHLHFHLILFATGLVLRDYLAAQSNHTICIDTDNPKQRLEHPPLHATTGVSGFTGLYGSVYAVVGTICQHFDPAKPNPASVERCCDKFGVHALVEQAGIPIPAFCLLGNAADIPRSAADIPSTANPSQPKASIAASFVGRDHGQVALGAAAQASDSSNE